MDHYICKICFRLFARQGIYTLQYSIPLFKMLGFQPKPATEQSVREEIADHLIGHPWQIGYRHAIVERELIFEMHEIEARDSM